MTGMPNHDANAHDLQRQIALLSSKNDRMTEALIAAREQIVELKRQIDELAKPPGSYAIFVGARDDGTVDVISAGRKMHVGASPSARSSRSRSCSAPAAPWWSGAATRSASSGSPARSWTTASGSATR